MSTVTGEPTLDLPVPMTLPVENLSKSAIDTFIRCPTRWKRRYVDKEYEPTGAKMLLGNAVGAAENHADQVVVGGGERPSSSEVLDLYDSEFEERAEREDVKWEEPRGEVKDSGVGAIRAYEKLVVPTVPAPLSVERRFLMQFEGVQWGVEGYFDREEADGGIADRKVTKRAPHAKTDLQAAMYLLARRSEGNPAPEFRFHLMKRLKVPTAEVLATRRTDAQLDALVSRIYDVAAEMLWRLETDVWAFAAPGEWTCNVCGYLDCPFHPKGGS